MQDKLIHIRSLSVISLLLLVFSCSKKVNVPESNASTIQTEKPVELKVALNLNDSTISVDQLESALLGYAFADSNALDSSIKDYVYQLQLFEEAKSQGFNENQVIIDEIQTYKRILAEEALLDSTLLADMIVEAYDHMKYELKASHLFIALPKNALPKDTVFVFNELMRIREEAISLSKFDSLVSLYSQDRRTNKKGGSLGWFGALQMVYSIEKAAYNLGVGDVSLPIRSNQGYHLIYLEDQRPSLGAVQVRHLLKTLPTNADSLTLSSIQTGIDSLHILALKDPEVFQKLIKENSEDYNTNENGGLLPFISTGSRVERVFEEACFQLDSGQISNVIQTTVGFHIIQRVKTKGIGSLDDNYELIKQKTLTDSRGQYLEELSLLKAAQKIGFKEKLIVPNEISSLFDKSILSSRWIYQVQPKDKILFSYSEGVIKLSNFLKYVEDRQSFDPIAENTSVDMAILKYYTQFKKENLKALAIEDIYRTSNEVKNQLRLIEKDLVCTKYFNQAILEKAVADTLGQRRWYESNIEQFKKSPRAYATIIHSKNAETAKALLKSFEQAVPYRLKRGIQPIYFSKNFYFLNDDAKRRLTGLFAILQKNPNYIVEIGGHRDVAEESYISNSRVSEVIQYLRGLGLEITRIKESDYAQTRLKDRFDWTQNQRVSIQFFSSDFLDVIPSFEKINEDIVKVQRKWFTIEEAPYLWDYIDKGAVIQNDSSNLFVHTKRIDEPGNYSLKEVRGRVINAYQVKLENDLKKKLDLKYPIKLNEEEINGLKKSLLKKI